MHCRKSSCFVEDHPADERCACFWNLQSLQRTRRSSAAKEARDYRIDLDALSDNAEQLVWCGRAKSFIFSSALHVGEHDVIGCGIVEHPSRKAEYFQLETIASGLPLHLYHNHGSTTKTDRKLRLPRKKLIVRSFWSHVGTKSSAAQPAGRFSGDSDCTPLEWTMCFQEMLNTQASRETVQMCSGSDMARHHGDADIAINVRSTQEDSGFDLSWLRPTQKKEDIFTDTHKLVFVPVHWGRKLTESTAAQPAASSSSAAQPASAKSPEPLFSKACCNPCLKSGGIKQQCWTACLA